jgi:hypothetical protein
MRATVGLLLVRLAASHGWASEEKEKAATTRVSSPEMRRVCRALAGLEALTRELYAAQGIDYDTDVRSRIRAERASFAEDRKNCER